MSRDDWEQTHRGTERGDPDYTQLTLYSAAPPKPTPPMRRTVVFHLWIVKGNKRFPPDGAVPRLVVSRTLR